MTSAMPQPTVPSRRRPWGIVGWRSLAAVAVLAGGYRALVFSEAGDHVLLRQPIVDAGYHDAWAWRVACGDVIGHGPDDVFKPPLYPMLLGGIYQLADRDIAVVQVVQLAMGVASCCLLAMLGGLMLGRWPGRIAGLASAVYAPMVFFELQLLTLPVTLLLNLAALLVLLAGWDRARWRAMVPAGLLLGLSAGVRPDVLAPVGLIGAVLVLRELRPWRRTLRRIGGLLGGLLLVLVPIAVRNAHLTGQFIPVAGNAGINLYVGNTTGDGTQAVPVGLRWERLVATVPQETLERPADASRLWVRRTAEYAREHPGPIAGRLGRKLLAFVHGREFRNNLSMAFFRGRFAPLLGWPALQWSAVCPLGLAGLAGLWFVDRRSFAVLAAWIGGYALVGVAFFVTARFRLPGAVVFILPAAWAGVEAVGWVRRVAFAQASPSAGDSRNPSQPAAAELHGWRLALVGGVFAVAAVACWGPWFGPVESGFVRDWVNLGNAQRSAGDRVSAKRSFREALRVRPDDPDAHYLLAGLVGPAESARHLAAARRVLPRSPDVLRASARSALMRRQPAAARELLAELLAEADRSNLHPKRAVLAVAHLLLADLNPARAKDYRQRAWELDPATAAEADFLARRNLEHVARTFADLADAEPWNFYPRANLGLTLLQIGRTEEAVVALRCAAPLAPPVKRDGVRFHLARALWLAGQGNEARSLLGGLLRELPPGRLRDDVRRLRNDLSR